jgi:hypothetical protein
MWQIFMQIFRVAWLVGRGGAGENVGIKNISKNRKKDDFVIDM